MKKSSKLGGGGRFEKLSSELGKKGASNPNALAAWIGMHKYGKKKMGAMAAAGRRRRGK